MAEGGLPEVYLAQAPLYRGTVLAMPSEIEAEGSMGEIAAERIARRRAGSLPRHFATRTRSSSSPTWRSRLHTPCAAAGGSPAPGSRGLAGPAGPRLARSLTSPILRWRARSPNPPGLADRSG